MPAVQVLNACICAVHSHCCLLGEYARSVLYCAESDELVYPAGAVVVAMAAGNNSNTREAAAGTAAMPAAPAVSGAGSSSGVSASVQRPQQGVVRRPQRSQRFFVGHSAFVCCLALGGEGTLLATGQEGKAALIRLWDFVPGQQQRAADQAPTEDNCAASSTSTCLAVLCGEQIVMCLFHTVACALPSFCHWNCYSNAHTTAAAV
jgi:hypothetical protein